MAFTISQERVWEAAPGCSLFDVLQIIPSQRLCAGSFFLHAFLVTADCHSLYKSQERLPNEGLFLYPELELGPYLWTRCQCDSVGHSGPRQRTQTPSEARSFFFFFFCWLCKTENQFPSHPHLTLQQRLRHDGVIISCPEPLQQKAIYCSILKRLH